MTDKKKTEEEKGKEPGEGAPDPTVEAAPTSGENEPEESLEESSGGSVGHVCQQSNKTKNQIMGLTIIIMLTLFVLAVALIVVFVSIDKTNEATKKISAMDDSFTQEVKILKKADAKLDGRISGVAQNIMDNANSDIDLEARVSKLEKVTGVVEIEVDCTKFDGMVCKNDPGCKALREEYSCLDEIKPDCAKFDQVCPLGGEKCAALKEKACSQPDCTKFDQFCAGGAECDSLKKEIGCMQ